VPGLAVTLFINESYEYIIVCLLAAIIGLAVGWGEILKILSNKKYIKNFFVSVGLMVVGLVSVALTPEYDNKKAGAVMFLFIPAALISLWLLSGSSTAKKLKASI